MDTYLDAMRKTRRPDFEQFVRVLKREKPSRPVLFEIAPNVMVAREIMGDRWLDAHEELAGERNFMNAMATLGYDYSVLPAWNYPMQNGGAGVRVEKKETISLNASHPISDWASFETFQWPTFNEQAFADIAVLEEHVPEGMGILARSCMSVLEPMVRLFGFENLCFMLLDNPDLVKAVSEKLSDHLCGFVERICRYSFIDGIIITDDWGFKTQTMLAPAQIREYVVPGHRRAVARIHELGRHAIFHSCGQLDAVWDDIIDDIGYEGRHSYEDNIEPVEECYDKYHRRIAILGGMDMDFLARSSPGAIHTRSLAMLDRSREDGAYALGSGNSLPGYIPEESVIAMISAAVVYR